MIPGMTSGPRGPVQMISGRLHKDADGGWQAETVTRELPARRDRAPGSALIAAAAWLLAAIGCGALYVSFSAQRQYVFAARHQAAASITEALLLDLLMICFTLLALGLSRAGKPCRTERALILACAIASAYMNISAADTASPRSVAAYAVAPVALAVVVDRVVAVIRRHVLADAEDSAWTAAGRAAAAAARLAGLTALYTLRLCLAAGETAKGLRQIVLDAAPLPGALPASTPGGQQPGTSPPCPPPAAAAPVTKKAAFLALYRSHRDYGNRAVASKVAAELAPAAGLQAGTARSYAYEEIGKRTQAASGGAS